MKAQNSFSVVKKKNSDSPTHTPRPSIDAGAVDAGARVSVAGTPRAHGHVGDGVVVRLEHLVVAEYVVTEGIQLVQRYTDVRGLYPFLDERIYDVNTFSFLCCV